LLAKRSGGWRLLEVPHPYLMALQRRLLDDLLDRVPPHEAACAYARERSVVDHARALCARMRCACALRARACTRA
jgi:hypothetical protein